jgi:very-short-patch-repair endonuclease
MTQFEKDIIAIISASPGIKARDIAKRLNVERSEVNSVLYSSLKSKCYQDSSYRWYVNGAQANTDIILQADMPIPDKKLSDLCKYYLNCLSLEESSGISAFLTSKYSLDYAELNRIGFDDSNEDAIRLLQKATSQRNLSSYVGFPVMIEKIHSTRTNEDYLKIAPVFLFAVDNEGGSVNIASIPSVNMEVIKQYSSRDINTQVYDLVELENELGLNDSEADIEIDELVARLQSIRQWQWRETIDPNNIDTSFPIGGITNEGIYNRAILIISERSPYTIGLESELSQLMNTDENSYKDTALYKWIHNNYQNETFTTEETIENILEVLPLNTEQEQAVRNSLTTDLTVVTGPPGTGKSQVVTEILINAAWQGKNVLFASKNNKAVDVVDTRINSLGRRPIMLRIGGNQYAYRLAELITDLLAYTADETDRAEYNQYNDAYQKQSAKYLDIKNRKDVAVALRNRVDHIEQKFCLIRDEWGDWFGKVNEDDLEALNDAFNGFISGYNGAQKHKQTFLTKLFWGVVKNSRIEHAHNKIESLNQHLRAFSLKELPAQFEQITEQIFIKACKDIQNSIDALQTMVEYKLALDNLNSSESLESLDKQLFEQKKLLAAIAGKLWNKWLVTRPLQISAQKRSEMNQFTTAMKLIGDVDLGDYPDLRQKFNKLQKDMTQFLPCWAVTSLSAKGRIPFQPGIFDLVIIDEASQCDIASVLPLLYRAKRAVIIGDPKQLSHISSISKAQDLGLLQKYGISFDWSYSANSLYALASGISESNDIIQLRDHHRSFGEIIEFSNNEFYDGKLRVATNYERLNCPKNKSAGIRWIDIVGQTVRPSSGGAYNDAEVKEILNELRRLVVDNDYCGSVGVVTPFRTQADRIREAVEKMPDLKEYLYLRNDFLVDTVHRFQGDERDIMMFSPVISVGTQDSTIGFLNSTGNLFNVAITRARAILVVIGDMNYCANCKVPYMEHFVDYVRKRDERAAVDKNVPVSQSYGAEYPYVSNADQVSDWEKILYSALYKAGVKTTPQYPVDKYKLDLALFAGNRKLDIEVDGEMYHKDWNGELCYRDQLRNHRLFEMGWDVKRFWVYQIRDELAQCISQVQKWINKAM